MTIIHILIAAIVTGVGATLLVDAWNLVLEHVFGLRSLNYCFLGRWIGHMRGGVFRHRAIAAAATTPFECPLGLFAHYTIGAMLAVGFIAGVGRGWLQSPNLVPALFYGVATVIFPFFILQPALGLGIASAAARRPTLARLKSLSTHVVYGVGLYLFGLVASRILSVG